VRNVFAAVAACSILLASSAADARVYKIAWYNIKSGSGRAPLPGRMAPFVSTHNCTDPTQPLNAWGVGLLPDELRTRIGNDPDVIALGLAEAWRCGSAENVRKLLAWKARSAERNGLVLVARHGFAAPEKWIQLDTSLNVNPRDTRWVVRAPVCVDAACTESMVVFATHWYAAGDQWAISYDRQLRATLDFMSLEREGHLLIGDLNTYEGEPTTCRPSPNNAILPVLRAAGYMDAWPAVHAAAEGFTGMASRKGCGAPEGYAFKRIDYAWVKGLTPTAMSRFGMAPPGEASLSDHYGLIVSVARIPPSSTTDRREIVLRTSSAATVAGAWRIEADGGAAEGRRLRHPDAGAPKLTSTLAAPSNYVELPFDAEAGRPYRVWIRGRADRDSYMNDSVFLQFSGSVNATGTPSTGSARHRGP
jgi:hypothetical protein